MSGKGSIYIRQKFHGLSRYESAVSDFEETAVSAPMYLGAEIFQDHAQKPDGNEKRITGIGEKPEKIK